LNNLIPPPKGLMVISNCSCNRRGFVIGRSIEDMSEEFEGVHG